MINKDEEARVNANVEVIQGYLLGRFKGFELTDTQDRPLSHTFTATKSSDERYKLKVSWPQLSDIGNTPERTKKRLVTDDVAGRMRGMPQREYFWWGEAIRESNRICCLTKQVSAPLSPPCPNCPMYLARCVLVASPMILYSIRSLPPPESQNFN